jgi:hypothetical protein
MDLEEPLARLPIWRPVASRADKHTDPFHELHGVVDDRLSDETGGPFGGSMLYYGNSSYWGAIGEWGRVEAYVAIGLAARPEMCALARRALAACGQCFTYERYCFITERPESIHHPARSKEGPLDRIIIRWRDGFVCDQELSYTLAPKSASGGKSGVQRNKKEKAAAASYTADDILGELDDVQAGEPWKFPMFDHEDYATLTVRLSAFRDQERWAILLCAVEWSSDDLLTPVVMPVGNCVRIPSPENYAELRAEHTDYVREHSRPLENPFANLDLGVLSQLGISKDLLGQEAMRELEGDIQQSAGRLSAMFEDHDKPLSGAEFESRIDKEMDLQIDYMGRRLDTVQVEYDFDDESLAGRGYVSSVRIRGKAIDLSQYDIDEDDETEGSFRLAVAVLRQYRDDILPTDAELSRFFQGGMPPRFLVAEAWHYSKWGLASEWEVFQQLAHAMVAGDASLYQPTEEPTTDREA